MRREWASEREIDRSNWTEGPWDSEPDYYEWDTEVGYPAFMGRLDTGAWYGVVEAPHPSGQMLLAFSHHMRDHSKYDQRDHTAGMISKTDIEGIGAFCLSMEHYGTPSEPNKKGFGPYKTFEDVQQICEEVASEIYETHKDGSYVNYFK